MQQYTAEEFEIPELDGISREQINEHLKLYEGYVSKTNYILKKFDQGVEDDYVKAELRRRFPFEFNGMRLHEYYFGQLENGPSELSDESPLKQALSSQWGSFETWLNTFKETAKTRGTGWAILYYDKKAEQFFNQWIDFHHQGHLGPIDVVFALDMWEHSFMVDYTPGEKGTYIEKYFDNLDWEFVEQTFESIS